MYNRIILPFQMDMELFNNLIVNKSKRNYDELTRQIFQVMILDLQSFNNVVNAGPRFETLPDKNHDINLFQEISEFKELYLKYALNIYFTCFEYKLFDSGVFNHLLEHINEDSFVLYCLNQLNFERTL